MQLFERSEFCIFRNGFTISWELDKVKLEAVARAFSRKHLFENASLVLVLFCGEKSTERNALHVKNMELGILSLELPMMVRAFHQGTCPF
ncbi:MAG: hypothetical protein R3331_10815 [Sulfurospirillaceae bacterium]|nr:hypothetical protein [Sulfurospirillaceae bacterium]